MFTARPPSPRSAAKVAAICSVSLFATQAVDATTLTFETTPNQNPSTEIPSGYGSRATSPSQQFGGVAWGLAEGDGWTPNVVLSYSGFNSAGTNVSVWPSGYASLSDAMGHGNFDIPFTMTFTPDDGYLVSLNSFDIATWSNVARDTNIRIWDDNGSFDAPNLFGLTQLYLPATVYAPLTQPLQAQGALRLYVSNIGSTGLDNINFTQAVVPIPGVALLLGTAFGALGLGRFARRRRPQD